MTSIYQRAMGDEFDKLHPMIQKRFGFSSIDNVAQVGTGVMDDVWRGKPFTLPFLLLGSTRRVLFPSKGKNVPFTISNYAYVDSHGRETVTWSRRFAMKNRIRAFDATMIYSEQRKRVVDYIGTHQHVVADIECRADDDGGMTIRAGRQRFYEGRVGFDFPMIFSGYANVREWYDEAIEKYRITVSVENEKFGRLFGYSGSFTVREFECSADQVPLDVKPLREERRE
jgi:hypothetical protein